MPTSIIGFTRLMKYPTIHSNISSGYRSSFNDVNYSIARDMKCDAKYHENHPNIS